MGEKAQQAGSVPGVGFAAGVIYGTRDPDDPQGSPWLPLKLDQVPADIRDPAVIARMRGDEIAQSAETGFWYRFEEVQGG